MCFDLGTLATGASELWEAEGPYLKGRNLRFSGGPMVGGMACWETILYRDSGLGV